MCFSASPTGDRSRVYYEDRNRVSPAPGSWAGPEAGTTMALRRKEMIWWIVYSHLESNRIPLLNRSRNLPANITNTLTDHTDHDFALLATILHTPSSHAESAKIACELHDVF